MRWLKTGETITEETRTEEDQHIWWSGNEKKYEGGIGFVVDKEHIGAVRE